MTNLKMILNKQEIHVRSKSDLLVCLQLLLESLDKYSPKKIFLENLEKSIGVVHDLADLLSPELVGRKNLLRELTNFKRKLSLLKNSFQFIKTKEDAVKLQFNILLSFENLGLLNGFGGATKFGDRIEYFNPERTTIQEVLP